MFKSDKKEYNKNYYLCHREKAIKNKKEYRHRIGISKKFYKKSGLSKKEYNKKYHIENMERRRLSRKKYKYNLKNAGELSVKTIQLVYEDNIKKYGTLTCYLCLKPIEFGKDSLEHKIPLSRGGTNEYNNLAIAHFICNIRKHTKTELEYKKGEANV